MSLCDQLKLLARCPDVCTLSVTGNAREEAAPSTPVTLPKLRHLEYSGNPFELLNHLILPSISRIDINALKISKDLRDPSLHPRSFTLAYEGKGYEGELAVTTENSSVDDELIVLRISQIRLDSQLDLFLNRFTDLARSIVIPIRSLDAWGLDLSNERDPVRILLSSL
ncbi:hypothetical protein AX16_001119 [Volvariella volvacea WC 439]|nr:hypothetical protein AX16_001119 [Volvariella volvacea WC 439]